MNSLHLKSTLYFFLLKTLICFLGCFDIAALQAQNLPQELYFSTIEGNVPRSRGTIFEDSKGYIWIGTAGGLTRHDGANVKLYKTDPMNVNSLSCSEITDLTEDNQGKLWISTPGGGLNVYDHSKEEFQHFRFDKKDNNSISNDLPKQLLFDKEGHLWIGFDDEYGLNQLNPTTGKIVRFLVEKGKPGRLQGQVIGNLIETEQRIYLGTTAGLEYYDKTTQQFHYIPLVNAQNDTISNYPYPGIERSKDGKIWIPLPDKGLGVYDESQEQMTFYPLETADGIVCPQIWNILEDSKGRLWLLNDHTLWSLSPDRSIFQKHILKPSNANLPILIDTPNSFYIDSYDNIWIGPHYYDQRKSIFTYYSVLSKIDNSSAFVDACRWIDSSQVIITLNKTSLFIYDLKQKNYRLRPTQSKPYYFIKDGVPLNISPMGAGTDQQGDRWLGTWGDGLFMIKKEIWKNSNGVISEYDHFLATDNPSTIPTNRLLNIRIDSQNDIWVCGNVGGITRINKSNMTFTQYDFVQGKNSVSDTYTFDVAEDKKGTIWISTNNGGLNKFNRETEQFTIFNRNNGMLDEDLFQIEQDSSGWLWLNTAIGLSSLNPETEKFTNYNQKDGLITWKNNFSIVKKNNVCCLPGDGGFQIVDLNALKDRPTYKSPLRINEIQVFDPDEKKFQMCNAIEWQDQTLTLSYQENTLTLQFAIIDFRNPIKHEYQYAITQGSKPDWIAIGQQTQIGVNQLSPNTYYFHLKACNSDKIWTTLEKPLQFTIHPPFWQTTWAYLVYLMTILGLLYYLYRFNLNRQLEQAEARQLKEMDSLKSRFYTNITHEFRTPLTVILGMTRQLSTGVWTSKVSTKEKNRLAQGFDLIQRNGKKLLHLINQLLDLSKLDTNNLKPHYQPKEIVSFVQYLGESFESIADRKGVRLSIYSEMDELVMEIDEVKLQQIISNLLSNAIKFTPARHKVTLHLSQKEEQLQIKVKDTGIGISTEALPHIFDRFYQVDNQMSRQGEGTGIGLALVKELVELMQGNISVESKEGKGTSFVVVLPIITVSSSKSSETSERALKEEKHQEKLDKIRTLSNEKATTLDLPVLDSPFRGLGGEVSHLPHLLIAEDNPDVIFYIQSVLTDYYQVTIAQDGQAGIDKAVETIPDIIISDVMMPKKNGFELLETLKQDERTSHIPIILLTAKATQQDKLAGLKYGADAYLMKPFDKEELLVRLGKLLEMRKALQQRYSSQDMKALFQKDKQERSYLNNPEDQFFQKLHAILEKHYSNPKLKVQRIAEQMHLSYQQLNRKIKALTDKTTALYLRSYRLQKAKALLQTQPELNISEVAYDVGFDSPNYFTRVFAEEFGVSPNEVRA